jgi:hypothetical protein
MNFGFEFKPLRVANLRRDDSRLIYFLWVIRFSAVDANKSVKRLAPRCFAGRYTCSCCWLFGGSEFSEFSELLLVLASCKIRIWRHGPEALVGPTWARLGSVAALTLNHLGPIQIKTI